MKQNFTRSTRAIEFSISTKILICQKTEDEPAYCPDRKEISQIIDTIQKFSLFPTDGAIV